MDANATPADGSRSGGPRSDGSHSDLAGSEVPRSDAPRSDGARSRSRGESLRIGDVARLLGTTPSTIRYYEELGLLGEAPARPSGQHRLYTEAEVARVREVMRLKHLL